MSAHHDAADGDAVSSGRPKRILRRTQKAKEIAQSGEEVPGVPSLGGVTSYSFTPAAQGVESSSILKNTTSASAMPARPTTTVEKFARDDNIGPKGNLPSFAFPSFTIYRWDGGVQPNSLALSDSRKAEKARMDKREMDNDIDDGSDDWEEFSGVPEHQYSFAGSITRPSGFQMEYAVANNFMIRAKRAFWKGVSWEDFEFDERTKQDSQAHVRAEPNPGKRQKLFEIALDNELRLAIFDRVKKRLCEEIWLEKYSEPPGLAKLPLPFGKRDSKAPTPDERAVRTEGTQVMPKRGELGEDKPGRPRDALSRHKRKYDDMMVPGGRQNSALDNRGEARIGNIGVNGLLGMTMVEEIASRPLDFDTSNEEEAAE